MFIIIQLKEKKMLRYTFQKFGVTSTTITTEKISAFKNFFSSYIQRSKVIRVKNKESTARDHLANERTFLAFARTGISFFGAALALWTSYCFKFDPKNPCDVHPKEIVPAATGLVFNGAMILVYAFLRFFAIQNALENGEFIIAKRRFVVMILVICIVTTWSLNEIYAIEMKRKTLLL